MYKHKPASLGRARQLPWPCFWIYLTSFWSSSGVQGPFLRPLSSQQGDLPMFNLQTLVSVKKICLPPSNPTTNYSFLFIYNLLQMFPAGKPSLQSDVLASYLLAGTTLNFFLPELLTMSLLCPRLIYILLYI